MPPNYPQTLLPLELFREIIGFHSYFWYSLANEELPITNSVELLTAEYTWQRPNAASRADYRQAIAVAEQKLSTALGYDTSTRYRRQVINPNVSAPGMGASLNVYSNPYRGYGYAGGWGYGAPNLFYLQVGKLQCIATISYEPLETSATIVYTDANGDGITDTFTGTFADTTDDPATLIACFKVSDRAGSPRLLTDPINWQIRPATFTQVGGNIVVTGPSQLLVKPILYEPVTPSLGYNSTQTGLDSSGSLDPNNTTTNFVSELTIYKKVYSLENQAVFVRRYGGIEDTYPVTATIVDADLGAISISLDNCGCYSGGNSPSMWGPITEEIRINYEAGATSPEYNGQANYLPYQTDWDVITARFAAAELAADPQATQRRNPQLYYWREDLALMGNAQLNNLYKVSDNALNNGFRNTRRGAVGAWAAVVSLLQLRSIQT